MDIDFTDFRILLSILFIFIGTTVFYIASLISGHNIYRDMEYRISILTSIIVGFLIFIFSPLCFLVLFPSLFGVFIAGTITVECIEKIHDIIVDDVLIPYLLSAFGLGIAFGCLSSIELRPLILHDFRRRIGIDFPIRTYGFAWDSFLYNIKRNGKIKINQKNHGENSENWYHLLGFSIKSEPRELLLKKINDNGNGSEDLLTSNIESIKEIYVPPESLKKNHRTETPSSFALHLAFSSMGFILLFESFHMTSDLLNKFKYLGLADLYMIGGFFFLVASLISTIASFKFLVNDYKHIESVFILCFIPSFIVIVNFAIILGVIYHIFCLDYLTIFFANLIKAFNYIFESSFSKIVVGLLSIIVILQWFFIKKFKDIQRSALSGTVKEKQKLLGKLEDVILSFDENKPNAELDPTVSEVKKLVSRLKNELGLPYFL